MSIRRTSLVACFLAATFISIPAQASIFDVQLDGAQAFLDASSNLVIPFTAPVQFDISQDHTFNFSFVNALGVEFNLGQLGDAFEIDFATAAGDNIMPLNPSANGTFASLLCTMTVFDFQHAGSDADGSLTFADGNDFRSAYFFNTQSLQPPTVNPKIGSLRGNYLGTGFPTASATMGALKFIVGGEGSVKLLSQPDGAIPEPGSVVIWLVMAGGVAVGLTRHRRVSLAAADGR